MNLTEHRDFIATVATIVTIVQFLSGIDICRKIVKQGSTGDISGFPFVGGAFSTCMWLTYSWLLHDVSMILTNAVGFSLQMTYLMVYLKYCISPGSWYALRRQMGIFFSVDGFVLYYVFLSGVKTEVVMPRVGLVCCVASVIFCAAPLISLTEVFRTQSTESLPFPLIAATFAVTGLWWLYGLIIQNDFVKYPNLVGCLLSGTQLLLFVVYPSKRKELKKMLPEITLTGISVPCAEAEVIEDITNKNKDIDDLKSY